ncbi:PQQ-dependent sugar dehydrogenase [Algicella marina]|uniref:PQQ-dependent sugar dehydrogenase n=1 Tax=Algicella marina TaxID=2683284 RepID=A0A6P1T215_9RHOB|nr:PQQ-dependent sugar dehydrogenase [Algicella marina]QHQ35339.1 PQQ-dependent sugar dehydrogenase [Algicella marina]
MNLFRSISLAVIAAIVATALFVTSEAEAETVPVDGGEVEVTRMVTGLDEPWAIAFLPSGGLLITERDGRLLRVMEGSASLVSGVPEVAVLGQGGLLDVVLARDFATTRTLFISYAKPMQGGAGTALAAAELSADGSSLQNVRDIFTMNNGSGAGQHFGSRIVEAPDGKLFLTIGERGARELAQDKSRFNGKVVRINRDGSIPADNPFVGGDGLDAIWSLGHRNPQGAALDETGTLWTVEHGAQGGDEINRPEPGLNYGWPVISYGRHYSGGKIGQGTSAPGLEQPAHYWDPSIAPSGMMVYSGSLFPEWQGDIFVGSLKFNMISRLVRDGSEVTEAERLFQDRYTRIRDIREAPDGSIWFLSVGDGAAYRMTPAD